MDRELRRSRNLLQKHAWLIREDALFLSKDLWVSHSTSNRQALTKCPLSPCFTPIAPLALIINSGNEMIFQCIQMFVFSRKDLNRTTNKRSFILLLSQFLSFGTTSPSQILFSSILSLYGNLISTTARIMAPPFGPSFQNFNLALLLIPL